MAAAKSWASPVWLNSAAACSAPDCRDHDPFAEPAGPVQAGDLGGVGQQRRVHPVLLQQAGQRGGRHRGDRACPPCQ